MMRLGSVSSCVVVSFLLVVRVGFVVLFRAVSLALLPLPLFLCCAPELRERERKNRGQTVSPAPFKTLQPRRGKNNDLAHSSTPYTTEGLQKILHLLLEPLIVRIHPQRSRFLSLPRRRRGRGPDPTRRDPGSCNAQDPSSTDPSFRHRLGQSLPLLPHSRSSRSSSTTSTTLSSFSFSPAHCRRRR